MMDKFETGEIQTGEMRRISSPLLTLWSSQGALDTWYAEAGGPIALWQAWSDDVEGHPLNAGHFFPEEAPEHTAKALERFFATDKRGRGTNDLLQPTGQKGQVRALLDNLTGAALAFGRTAGRTRSV
jgi:hypothetical protein